MESDEDNTPQQKHEEGENDTGGSKKWFRNSDSLFPLSDSSKKAKSSDLQCKLYELQCELAKLKLEAEDDSEKSDVVDNLYRKKFKMVYQESPIKPEKTPGKTFNRW